MHLHAPGLTYRLHGQQRWLGGVHVVCFLGDLPSSLHKFSKAVLKAVGCTFLSVSTMISTAGISGFSSIIHQSVLVFRIFSRLTADYLFLHFHPLHGMQVLYYNYSFPGISISWFNFHDVFHFSESFLKKKNCSSLLHFSLGFVNIFGVCSQRCYK